MNVCWLSLVKSPRNAFQEPGQETAPFSRIRLVLGNRGEKNKKFAIGCIFNKIFYIRHEKDFFRRCRKTIKCAEAHCCYMRNDRLYYQEPSSLPVYNRIYPGRYLSTLYSLPLISDA